MKRLLMNRSPNWWRIDSFCPSLGLETIEAFRCSLNLNSTGHWQRIMSKMRWRVTECDAEEHEFRKLGTSTKAKWCCWRQISEQTTVRVSMYQCILKCQSIYRTTSSLYRENNGMMRWSLYERGFMYRHTRVRGTTTSTRTEHLWPTRSTTSPPWTTHHPINANETTQALLIHFLPAHWPEWQTKTKSLWPNLSLLSEWEGQRYHCGFFDCRVHGCQVLAFCSAASWILQNNGSEHGTGQQRSLETQPTLTTSWSHPSRSLTWNTM